MLRLKFFLIILAVAVQRAIGKADWYTASDGQKYYIDVEDKVGECAIKW